MNEEQRPHDDEQQEPTEAPLLEEVPAAEVGAPAEEAPAAEAEAPAEEPVAEAAQEAPAAEAEVPAEEPVAEVAQAAPPAEAEAPAEEPVAEAAQEAPAAEADAPAEEPVAEAEAPVEEAPAAEVDVPAEEPVAEAEAPVEEAPAAEVDVPAEEPVAEAEAPDEEMPAGEARTSGGQAASPTGVAASVAAATSVEAARRRRRPAKRTLARAERRERSVAKRRRRRTLFALGGGAIASLLILGIILPSVVPLASAPVDSSPTPVPTVGTQVPVQAAVLVAEGESHEAYTSTPPTSGAHYADPAPWGVLTEQQADEALVKNLQVGAVVAHHNLTDPAAVDALTVHVEGQAGYPGCLVTQPNTAVPEGSVVLTAWGWMQSLSGFDSGDFDAFVAAHRNRGPLFIDSNCGVTAEVAVPTPTPAVPDHTNP